MPSNDDLRKTAAELAEGLGLDVKTDGLNNDKLAALVSDLKAKKKDADTQTAADAAEAKAKADKDLLDEKAKEDSAAAALKAKADAAEAREAANAKKPPFYVMPGKCLTSKRGLLATEHDAEVKDYAEIKADDLAGGKEALDAFVRSGHIGKA